MARRKDFQVVGVRREGGMQTGEDKPEEEEEEEKQWGAACANQNENHHW